MFVLSSFQIGQQMIKLVFPEEKQAEELFEIIETDRKALSEWMPWTKNVKSKKCLKLSKLIEKLYLSGCLGLKMSKAKKMKLNSSIMPEKKC